MNMIERKHLHHVSDNNNVVSNEKGNIHTTTLPLYICYWVGREARPLKKKKYKTFRSQKSMAQNIPESTNKKGQGKD